VKSRRGIFGGTFDPVHTGHIHSALSFLNSGLIDDLLVLLTPDPPHKDTSGRTPYHHRLEMLRLAFNGVHNVIVSDLETTLPQPSYTLQTVDYLTQANPDTLFYLCIGQDSLSAFHTWYKYEEILAKTDLLVAERPGYPTDQLAETIRESVIFVNHEPVDISSTRIRNRSHAINYHTPQAVIDYILENQLYKKP